MWLLEFISELHCSFFFSNSEWKTRESVGTIIIKNNIYTRCRFANWAILLTNTAFTIWASLLERSGLCAYQECYGSTVCCILTILFHADEHTHTRGPTTSTIHSNVEKWRKGRKTETNSNSKNRRRRKDRKKQVAHSLLLTHKSHRCFTCRVVSCWRSRCPMTMLFFTLCFEFFIFFVSLFCDCAISLNCSCSFDGVGRVRCLPICNETNLSFEQFQATNPVIIYTRTRIRTTCWERSVLCAQIIIIRIPDNTSPSTTPQYRWMQNMGRSRSVQIMAIPDFVLFLFFHFLIWYFFFCCEWFHKWFRVWNWKLNSSINAKHNLFSLNEHSDTFSLRFT